MAPALLLIEKLSAFLFLVCSMFAVGLTLTLPAITTPLRNWRRTSSALVLNFLLAPGLAWLLTTLIPLNQGHAIGLLLLGGAAGAPFLPKLVASARGDLEFAIALMVLLTIGTIFFMPIALPRMIPGLTSNPLKIASPLLFSILLPLAAGIVVKRWNDRLAARAAPVFAKIGSISLLVLFVLLIGLNLKVLFAVLGSGAILAAILHLLGLFAAGWFCGESARETRSVLALGTAARNFGAALAPAATSFSDPNVTVMLVVCAIVGLILSFSLARWIATKEI